MDSERITIKSVCFGEVLWDNLPTGRKLGGAPLNVAYHLNKLGVDAEVLTRVGDDTNGKDIHSMCKELNIPTSLFQKDLKYPTSTVEVHFDENKDVHYEIVYPVAWDYIEVGEKEIEAVKNADIFVFGSLSTRNIVSYKTLKALMAVSKYNVLDVNLRAPHYSKERVFELLHHADLVKMNQEELNIISSWFELAEVKKDSDKVEEIMREFDVNELIVTCGAKGAIYHSSRGRFSYYSSALKVEVKDTIGSGDSFLAAFLAKRFHHQEKTTLEEMMEFATALSAFVTQNTGACPSYDAKTINRFVWLNSLQNTKY